MGEVYLATDTNLKRQVAIKILPELFAADAERLARFQREAELLASLNHPNIAAVYGLERGDRTTALVMELVEGPTLADRIAEGPLPLDEAMPIAAQIAEALAAAHDLGIVHRDLKPANLKVRPDGTVKVLDFGLAKGLQDAGTSGPRNLVHSPTFTSPAMTQAGVVLGTAAYMAPEQARGRAVDKRADIWAFGCVLYEMVAGRRAFDGEDITETMAAVVMKEPDLAPAPAELRPLLAGCLQKDPKKRLRDISGFAPLWDLGRALSGSGAAITPVTASPARSGLLPWSVAAGLAVAAGVAIWAPWHPTPTIDRPLIRLDVELGPGAVRSAGISAIVSPDGSRLVYVARDKGNATELYTRRLDQKDAAPLIGTEAFFHQPFFSPDGEWVGFRSADNQIKKVSVQGGSAVTVAPWPGTNASGASWGDDGNIVLGSFTGLWIVPSGGGAARQLSHGDHLFPDVLPGSKAVLYAADEGQVTTTLDSMIVYVMRVDTGESKKLVDAGFWPRYVPASPSAGYLTYVRGNTLFAAGFDPDRLELLGTPVPVLDDVAANLDYFAGGGQVAASRNGTVVYLSGGKNPPYPLVWLDKAGTITPLVAEPGVYGAPRLSPDGTRVAYIASDDKGTDVWVYDLGRKTAAQRTFLGTINFELAWAPGSEHLVYGDGKAMWWIRADGAGRPQLIADKLNGPRPFSFGPLSGGRTHLAFSPTNGSLPDVMTLSIDMTDPDRPKVGTPEPFLSERDLVEVDPAFSPDGKFIAYAANTGGADEDIYVRSFPGPGGQWKVSTAGGKAPAWSPATHELLFLGGDDRIMAADYVITGDSFTFETPHPWSPTLVRRNGVQQSFDITRDGRRIVTLPRPPAEEGTGNLHATFLLNFGDELKRRVPLGK
jgi:Tol biopolymer transport system component